MTIDWSQTRISCDIDLAEPGRQFGDLRLPFSDNHTPLGYYPIPIITLSNGDGPTLLLCGGTHGDEYEGPAAIIDLAHSLDLGKLCGRVIAIPACNAPAFVDKSRCSPLDGGNLNRAYPGDPNGSPTAMIAHFIEALLIPECDAVVDFHAGGKASVFSVMAMISQGAGGLLEKNLELARAFSPDFIWVFDETRNGGSVNDAAKRQGVPMFASELFGSGNISRESFRRTREGLLRVMHRLGMIGGAKPDTSDRDPTLIRGLDDGAVYAKRQAVFAPEIELNQYVKAGDLVGTLFSVMEPERKPKQLKSPVNGIVVSLVHRGLVERGERLVLLAQEILD